LFRDALGEMFALHRHLRSAILIVHPAWRAAREIYRAEGFAEIGEIDAYFVSAASPGVRLPAIVMRRAGTAGRGA